MEPGQEAAPVPLLRARVYGGRRLAGEERREAPEVFTEVDRTLDHRSNGPAERGDLSHQPHFVPDRGGRICPATEHKLFAAALDEPVEVESSAQGRDQPNAEALQDLRGRLAHGLTVGFGR